MVFSFPFPFTGGFFILFEIYWGVFGMANVGGGNVGLSMDLVEHTTSLCMLGYHGFFMCKGGC